MNLSDQKRICDLIKKSSNPLILVSENFDIDAVNGAIGLYLFLKKNKKNPKIACSGEMPEKFLPAGKRQMFANSIDGECSYKISFNLNESQVKELSYLQEGNTLKIDIATLGSQFSLEKPRIDLARFSHDLVLSLGSPDLRSLGRIYRENICFFSEAPIVNIDCREENENFGSINLVEPDSSVSGMIAGIANAISRDAMDSEIASLFLAGVIAKTKNLRSARISAETFGMVSFLIKTGANKEEIIKSLVALGLLAEEKTEFYPPLEVTKQAVDSMNRSFPWYLRQEQERIEQLERTKISSSKRVFYFAALVGAVPSLIFIGQASFALAPVAKNGESIIASRGSIINNAEKLLPISTSKEALSAPISTLAPTPKPISSSASTSAPISVKEIPKQGTIGSPRKIAIPIIGVEAAIQEVGLTLNGEMGTPSNFKNAGWFKLGVKPGEIGNAVIAGHLDTATDNGGIFWSLNKVKIGDYIYVTDEFGKKMRFRTERSEVYRVEKAPMEEIFGSKSIARLNLITCNGAWDNGKRSYNKRLVVYAEYDPE